MKKFNKNIILFVLVVLFIVTGISSKTIATHLFYSLKCFGYEVVSGTSGATQNFINQVNNTSELLLYKTALLGLNSIKENVIGTRVIEKKETTVVKTDSGSLSGYLDANFYSEEFTLRQVAYIDKIREISTANGAHFLYCSVAHKNNYETLPPNVTDYNTVNRQTFLQALSAKGIPILDSVEVFEKCGMEGKDVFFRTDHHWTPLAGFRVAEAICRELNTRYGFAYNTDYTDLKNYNTTTYTNWFLGSYGKQVGIFFAGYPVDDFDLITPLFQTEFIEEIPSINSVRKGGFEDTMIYKKFLEKDYYEVNTYAAYSGGDFRLQKITNCRNADGEKILIIRQSYGCVVTPFLALQAKELHVTDDRDGTYPEGEKINYEEYIQSVKPDYVIVLK